MNKKRICPMCGGEISLVPRDIENLSDVEALCNKCNYIERFETMEQAIEAWNKRV